MRVSKRRIKALLHQCFSDFRIASHYGNDLHTYAHLCRRLKIGPERASRMRRRITTPLTLPSRGDWCRFPRGCSFQRAGIRFETQFAEASPCLIFRSSAAPWNCTISKTSRPGCWRRTGIWKFRTPTTPSCSTRQPTRSLTGFANCSGMATKGGWVSTALSMGFRWTVLIRRSARSSGCASSRR